jgi:hypothetical protein
MGFFSDLFSSDSAQTREEAARLGILIKEVERDCPIFSRDMESVRLERATAVRYSVPRTGVDRSTTWELLQRTKALGAALPNNYLLKSSGQLSDPLTRELTTIAQDFDEEYFEFEGSSSEVAVYWEEWGGPDKVQSLHQVLKRLAAL